MRMADCHPERKFVAKGLCRSCYQRMYLSRPSNKDKKNSYYMSPKWVDFRSKFYRTPAQRDKQREKRDIGKGIKDPLPPPVFKGASPELEDLRERQNDYKHRRTEYYRSAHVLRYNKWKNTPHGKAILAKVSANTRASRKLRVVKWADKKELYNIYFNKPKGMAVDHILPLRGEYVSGLHVPNNLQYLTKVENSIKSNSFDFTEDNNGWRNKLTNNS